MLGAGFSPQAACRAYDFDAAKTEEFVDLLDDMREQGYFKFIPVDLDEQDAKLRSLLNHHPRRIQLLMAQGCNLGCRYCYAWRNGSNQLDTLMSFRVAKASVDHLVERSAKRPELQITFFGGEALLNFPTIKKTVEYCRSLEGPKGKTFHFEVVTNGTLLDEEVTKFLVSERFRMMISIDGDRADAQLQPPVPRQGKPLPENSGQREEGHRGLPSQRHGDPEGPCQLDLEV